jgi:hypothetical protein
MAVRFRQSNPVIFCEHASFLTILKRKFGNVKFVSCVAREHFS